ncbi:hypothetical protein EQG49_12795 [Periweissella cryptocerci]|uniref:Uncharacterized protein n=1 Tax=Periweissella cryptocerci TaxID=2506420 RepID=A0A4P6YWR0_9LACO|nr:hypothetical protein [Periweissella cryptocerci]QBO37274.1 hypothetical protein EQG49_12795 [Periweissella cryptocerci]
MFIKNNGDFVRVIAGTNVVPGTNNFEDPLASQIAKELKTNVVLKTLLKTGEMEIEEAEFGTLKSADAIKLVNETISLDTLQEMADAHDGKTVQKAIKDRIAELTTPSDQENSDEGNNVDVGDVE